MKKNLLFALLLIVIGLMAQPALGIGCWANVEKITIAVDGGVQADLTGQWGTKTFSFCSLETQKGAVSPTTCKAIHNNLIVSQSTRTQTHLWFNGNAPATCAQLDVSYPSPAWIPFFNIGASVRVTTTPVL